MDLLLHGPFPINTCKYFQIIVGNPWMQMADCMHGFTPVYVRDLSIQGFWYPWGYWTTSSLDARDKYILWESKVIFGFLTVQGPLSLTRVVPGLTVVPLAAS